MFSTSDDLNSRPTIHARMSGLLGISFVRQDPPCRDKLFASSGFGFIDFLVHWERVQELRIFGTQPPGSLQVIIALDPTELPSIRQRTFRRDFLPTFASRVPSFLAGTHRCKVTRLLAFLHCRDQLSSAVTDTVLAPTFSSARATFDNSSAMHQEFVNHPIRRYTHRLGSMIESVSNRSGCALTCHTLSLISKSWIISLPKF